MTYSVSGDSSSQGEGAVYVDDEGRTWFAPSSGGLFWRQGGQTGQVKNAGLDRDIVYSLTGRKGELWIGRRRGGLTRLRYNGSSFTAETYTQADGLAQDSVYALHQSRDGSVWAGTVSGGLSRFKDGRFTTYAAARGLPSNTVTSMLESSDGAMWFATANGLCSLSHDQWAIYTDLDRLPPGAVNCLTEDSRGMIWIGTDNGIAVLNSYEIHVPGEVPASLHEPILGIAEDKYGRLWISTTNHVLRVEGDVDIRRSLEAGARGYMLKSMPPKDLVEVIRQVHAGKKRIPAEVAAHLAEYLGDEALTEREVDVLR